MARGSLGGREGGGRPAGCFKWILHWTMSADYCSSCCFYFFIDFRIIICPGLPWATGRGTKETGTILMWVDFSNLPSFNARYLSKFSHTVLITKFKLRNIVVKKYVSAHQLPGCLWIEPLHHWEVLVMPMLMMLVIMLLMFVITYMIMFEFFY